DLVYQVAFSPDDQTLASASKDRTVRTWNVEAGEVEKTLHGAARAAWDVAWSPDGEKLAAGWSANDKEPSIWVWNNKTEQVIRTFNNYTSSTSVAFSRDGKSLLAGCQD